MSAAPRVSVVVLSWNTAELLEACLSAVFTSRGAADLEVIVVDNASQDDSVARVHARFPAARCIVNPKNLGYAEGNNVGLRAASGRHVLLLNSDTEVAPDAIGNLADFLDAHPDVGAVGPRLSNPDGTVQRACMRFPGLLVAAGFDTWFGKRGPLRRVIDRYFYRDFDHLSSRDVEQPPGAALMVPRAVLARVGLLDPDLYLFFNDVDFARRVWRAGLRVHYLAEAQVMHHGGASTRHYRDFALEWHLNRARYYRRAFGAPGLLVARVMTAWRALEEWWRTARRMTDPDERRAAVRAIGGVVRKVWADEGFCDERARVSPDRP